MDKTFRSRVTFVLIRSLGGLVLAQTGFQSPRFFRGYESGVCQNDFSWKYRLRHFGSASTKIAISLARIGIFEFCLKYFTPEEILVCHKNSPSTGLSYVCLGAEKKTPGVSAPKPYNR